MALPTIPNKDSLTPEEYFFSLIKANPQYEGFENDLGLRLIAKDLEYKVNQTKESIASEIKEVYNPTREDTLLAHLAFRTGYLRFKKPLRIKCKLTSNNAVSLDKDTRFTDGNYVYYLDDFVHLSAGEPKEATLTLKEKHTIEQTLIKGTIFAHIPIPITYKECINISCFNGDKELKYSQNFVDWDSDFSIETLADTNLQVVLRLDNNNNVKLGDTIKVIYETSFDVDSPPDGITIIETGYDIVADDIQIYQNYLPPLSIEDMQYLIKYQRKNIGDIVVNEDFRQMFIRKVRPLKIIKVWQQREEAKYAGFDVSQINTVYVAYLTLDNKTQDDAVNYELKKALEGAIYGRNLVVREANIVDLQVDISIKTNDAYSSLLEDEIKDAIVGYYDDIEKKVSRTMVFQKVIPILNKALNIYELDIQMSEKGNYLPKNIFKIETVNIVFDILEG